MWLSVIPKRTQTIFTTQVGKPSKALVHPILIAASVCSSGEPLVRSLTGLMGNSDSCLLLIDTIGLFVHCAGLAH